MSIRNVEANRQGVEADHLMQIATRYGFVSKPISGGNIPIAIRSRVVNLEYVIYLV
jgi:hypothetical protein